MQRKNSWHDAFISLTSKLDLEATARAMSVSREHHGDLTTVDHKTDIELATICLYRGSRFFAFIYLQQSDGNNDLGPFY